MTNPRQAYALECDPARVRAAISRLYAEQQAWPRLPVDAPFSDRAREAHRTADWWDRLREQHRRLGEWARFTRQPYPVRRMIDDRERHALQKALAARARVAHWERCTAAVAMTEAAA